ncbi:MAG TPA: hypothetical protein VHD81_08520 [Mycobacteriales bacterium]|nr:hypothetical protein [Mycobacteriales bacterium]
MIGSLKRGPVVLAGIALLLGGSYATAAMPASHGKPVIAPAPAQAPSMDRSNGSCGPTDQTPVGKDLLWVHAHPSGLVAIWIPGLNSKKCVARRTTGRAALAERVAVAVRHAKAFPTEPLPCPYGDNTSVRLYFTYPTGGDEYAEVSLSGCRPITAPDRASRWSDNAVEKPLRKIAPKAWRSYLPTPRPPVAHIKQPDKGPVSEPAPSRAPSAAKHHGSCQSEDGVKGRGTVGGKNLVWLHRHPGGAVLIWRPGLNAKHCEAKRTTIGTQRARRIASAVDAAPAEPRGLFCPLDDGSSVDIYSTYAGRPDEFAHVEFTGCASVSAPDRSSRETTDRLDMALRSSAPKAWRHYVSR